VTEPVIVYGNMSVPCPICSVCIDGDAILKRNNEEGRELLEFACREGQESHIMQTLPRNVR
jgi:hypothetical protein